MRSKYEHARRNFQRHYFAFSGEVNQESQTSDASPDGRLNKGTCKSAWLINRSLQPFTAKRLTLMYSAAASRYRAAEFRGASRNSQRRSIRQARAKLPRAAYDFSWTVSSLHHRIVHRANRNHSASFDSLARNSCIPVSIHQRHRHIVLDGDHH